MKFKCPVLKERIEKKECRDIQQAVNGKGRVDGLELTRRDIKKCRLCKRSEMTLDDMMHIDMIDGVF